MTEALPAPDPARIATTTPLHDEVVTLATGTRVVRAYLTDVPYPAAWNTFRAHGPTPSRFDHHPDPVTTHPTHAISYVALPTSPVAATGGADAAFVTALAELFQGAGGGVLPIDRGHRLPRVAVIELTRDVTLLDVASAWTTRAGGNSAICSGPRAVCRSWARAIYAGHTTIDGIAYGSAVFPPGRCAALFERAQDAFGPAPLAERALSDSVLDAAVHDAARALGVVVT